MNIVRTNRNEADFYRLLGPYFGSRRIEKETRDRFYDDPGKTWYVTSGGVAPTLNRPLALAMLDAAFSAPGTQVDLIIRDKPVPAVVGKGMFYKRKKEQE